MRTELTSKSVQLGPDGPSISPLGIGAWAWGDRMVWGYGGDYTDSDLRTAFEVAVNRGISFYDTAEVYGMGRSEKLLGDFIRAAGAQEQVCVATKFFPYPWRLFGQRAVVSALQKSLERLQMDQVDLYQIHWPTPLLPIDTLMDGLADAVEQGLTKTVGVSNFDREQTLQAHEALARRGVPLASNQIEYSLIKRQPEQTDLLATCHDLNVTVIAYSPLGMGLLTGKYGPDNPPSGARGRRYSRDFLASLQSLITTMEEIGVAHDEKTPAQVAINWCVAKDTVPIPGVKNARQAEDNVNAVNWSLTDDEIAALDEASNRIMNS